MFQRLGLFFYLVGAWNLARFTSGWIKLHRRAIDEDIGRNVNLLAIWVTLLCWASRFESKIIGPDGPIVLPPGSVVFGMQELADHFKISKKTVHKWLHYLEKRGSIGIKRVTKGTIVSICNWKDYQGFEDEGVTEGKRKVNDEETIGKRKVTLNGEDKKERIEDRQEVSESEIDKNDWEQVCRYLLKQHPREERRIRRTYKQIQERGYEQEGKPPFKPTHLSAWFLKNYRLIRHEYAFHDGPTLVAVNEPEDNSVWTKINDVP